jgi:hypothetical protein
MNSICTVRTDCDLQEIYSEDFALDTRTVIKWCSTCGAVVIDEECDDRVYIGRVMKMQFPKNFNNDK